MIICTSLLMIYRLIEPYRLISHVLNKLSYCLFNVHLNCFVDFILFPTDKSCSKITVKKKIHLHLFRVKNKYRMTSFWSFYCSLRPQLAYQYSASTFILNKYLSAGRESRNALKTRKAIYLFRNKSCKAFFIRQFIIALN